MNYARKLRHQFLRAVVYEYDFAVLGGVVGDIVLRPHRQERVPNKALAVGAAIRVETVPTSGGAATVAVKLQGAADIQAAALISGAPWSTAGAKVPSALTFGAGHILTTDVRDVAVTVAVADLTAGKIQVVVFFVVLP